MTPVEITLLLLGLAVGVLLCSAVAERIDVPAPFLLVVVGVVASYVPGIPEFELSEDVVLFGLLPPLLYAAAQGTSLVDFNANRRPILLLSVGLVAFTTARRRRRHPPPAARDLVAARLRHRRRGRAARRGRGHRDRPADRAAAPDHHHPRGRVAAQRRDRPGGPRHRARGGDGEWLQRRPRRARLPDRGGRRRGDRLPVLPARGQGAPAPDRPGAGQRDVAGRARSRRSSPPRRCTRPG